HEGGGGIGGLIRLGRGQRRRLFQRLPDRHGFLRRQTADDRLGALGPRDAQESDQLFPAHAPSTPVACLPHSNLVRPENHRAGSPPSPILVSAPPSSWPGTSA